MKIYFEDGELLDTNSFPLKVDLVVDAGRGYSDNIMWLDHYNERDTNTVVYTNSIFVFNNWYAWNEELNVPEIYIRDKKTGEFKRIDELTPRRLTKGHNLAKLYINGEFNNF